MPKGTLENLLRICTKEAPFRNINGDLYVQTDGLTMGGPLSCTMANFYLCHVENKVMEDINMRPYIYARYLDDIFLAVRNQDQLLQIKNKLIENSVLNFTQENSINGKLPFLDVLVNSNNPSKFERSVYVKPTKSEDTINFNCSAPQKYKASVIHTLLHRAIKICSSEEAFTIETERIKRLLVNNGFPNRLCDNTIRDYRSKFSGINSNQQNTVSQSTSESDEEPVNSDVRTVTEIYYQNQYSENYKTDK